MQPVPITSMEQLIDANVNDKCVIIECDSTLYVGLAHAAHFTQYIAFTASSTNWLSEGSTSRYTCKEEHISSPGYLPSDRQHAKSRRTEFDKNSIFF